MSRCDCELLLHYSDCPYDGPDYTAARFDALEAEVAALRAAGDALAEAVNAALEDTLIPAVPEPMSVGTFKTLEDALDAWRALAGPGDRREDDR